MEKALDDGWPGLRRRLAAAHHILTQLGARSKRHHTFVAPVGFGGSGLLDPPTGVMGFGRCLSRRAGCGSLRVRLLIAPLSNSLGEADAAPG
jgi:hypothetical protein